MAWGFIFTGELTSLDKCFDKSVLYGQFYNTFTVLTILNHQGYSNAPTASLRLNSQYVEILQILWPKALVLLNLRSTPFGTHKLSLFEIITGFPMHLAPAAFNPQLVKGIFFNISKTLLLLLRMTILYRTFFLQCIPGR